LHLYIHIPFCKQACHYCDFHFSTNQNLKTEMALAIAKEIDLQKDYLQSKTLKTIYFGGGTPSLLNEKEFTIIFEAINQKFRIDKNSEITLEANPDDINFENLRLFKSFGINRLSIGLQSFNENHLRWMNRVHSATESKNAVLLAKEAGFDNLSLDLIYGIPSDSHNIWMQDLQQIIDLKANHVSAYCLTIEPKTVFGKWQKTNKIPKIDEEFAAQQFEIMLDFLAKNDFEQYEISNFAKNQQYSIHNTSYWQQEEYLGVGPSAHSYNLESRQFTVSNNAKYLKSLSENKIPFEIENLTLSEKTNDLLLTSLRTKWGLDLTKINLLNPNWMTISQKTIEQFQNQELISKTEKAITLTQKGKLFADKISAELFVE
jgi:oxygen-independent coproporphyrinogen III oxidase